MKNVNVDQNKCTFFLIGFMGAGKSTLLTGLKEHQSLNDRSDEWVFLDSDQEIAKKWGIDPRDLGKAIEERGFEEFRTAEYDFLKSLHTRVDAHSSLKGVIVALGGGTLNEEIWNAYFLPWKQTNPSSIQLCWLHTPFEECLRRMREDSFEKMRPLAKKSEKELLSLYQKRLSLYQLADIILSPEEQNHLKILDLAENLNSGA
jgi:shikimate kinase